MTQPNTPASPGDPHHGLLDLTLIDQIEDELVWITTTQLNSVSGMAFWPPAAGFDERKLQQ
jgi:hypothetical protein